MKPEDLESINGELFRALDLDDQQYIIGQATKSGTTSFTHGPMGSDYVVDFTVDWS